MPIPTVLRQHFGLLYTEFLQTYAPSPEGQAHRALYQSSRQAARANWERVLALRAQGANFTDAALLGLLPHAATSPEVTNGAWMHWAPVITGNIKDWFCSIGWATDEEWPDRAQTIVELLLAAEEGGPAFSAACEAYASSSLSKGIQAGALSPILNALWPERYALCNTKPALLLERFDGTRLSTQMEDYPASSAAIHHLTQDLSDELETEDLPLEPGDALDMFSHWLYALKGYKKAPLYLKVAPGEDAEDWQNCLARGDIGIGWDALGDLTGLDKKAFDARATTAIEAHDGYTVAGTNQVWRLVNANLGDYVVPTNGTKAMLGLGVISGDYAHVPESPYCHRRQVNWFSRTARQIDRPGWVRTIVRMNRPTFEEVVSGPVIAPLEDTAANWLRLLRQDVGFGRPFESPFYLEHERDPRLEAYEVAQQRLGRQLLAELIEDGRFDEIMESIRTVGQKTNLLWLQVPSQGDLNIIMQDGLDKATFCRAFFELLWGEGASPERLDRFRNFTDSQDLPAKWTFPTYFLFLLHPDSDYFVKPQAARWMLDELGRGADWDAKPNGRTYAAFLEVAQQLLELTRSVGARDMIDVQSLAWVAYRLQDPDILAGTSVGAPLDGIFAGRVEAEWALGLMAETTKRLGVTSSDDDRLVVTYAATDRAIKLHYGRANLLKFSGGPDGLASLRLALLDDSAPEEFRASAAFATVNTPVSLYTVSAAQLPAFFDEHHDEYLTAVDAVRDSMADLARSPYRKHDVAALGDALVDAEARERLLVEGFVPVTGLPEPLDQVFIDRDQAEWALDLMTETVERLGVSTPEDERLAVSYAGRDSAIKLIYCQVTPLQFWGRGKVLDRVRLALPDAEAPTELESTFHFESVSPSVSLYDVPVDAAGAFVSDHREAYGRALDAMRESMASHEKSGYRSSNVPELCRALFDTQARQRLLDNGFRIEPPPTTDGYFTARTFELLKMLADDPRYAVYKDYEAEFQSQLIEPFKQMMADLVPALPQDWLPRLETSRRITSIIPKNDFGRGGAWSHYWGAFYPKKSQRTRDAQLFVGMHSGYFEVGFSIGEHAGEVMERFWLNLGDIDEEIEQDLLGDLSGMGTWHFGNSQLPSKGFDEWLADSSEARVCVKLEQDRVLGLTKAVLIETVIEVFRAVWPLFLLATLDTPWPAIRDYLQIPPDDVKPNPEFTIHQVATHLSLPEDTVRAWLAGLERKKQAILYGPPGTGKTYAALALAKHLVGGGHGAVELVQFHPAYAYEDFVEGLRPESNAGQLSYNIKPGLLREFCRKARQYPESTYVLIIDEINRANLSRVFGELMYLLEYREQEVRLAVSGQAFSIPANVRIIGTMNTADRSIALVDHALRRRFAFIRLEPRWEIVEGFFAESERDTAGVDLAALEKELKRLNDDIEPDYGVGITFFLHDHLGAHLQSIWQMEIEPYLEEYFFDQPGKVDGFRWDKVSKNVIHSMTDAD